MKIRDRLALFLSLSAAGVLLVVSLIIYFASAVHRKQDFFNELKEEVRLKGEQLQKEPLQEAIASVGLRRGASIILPLENKQEAEDSLKTVFPANFVETLFREGYAEFQLNEQEGVGQLFAQEERKGIKKGPTLSSKAFYCAHEWIRTTTPIKAPPPQDGVSTSFTTCAGY